MTRSSDPGKHRQEDWRVFIHKAEGIVFGVQLSNKETDSTAGYEEQPLLPTQLK